MQNRTVTLNDPEILVAMIDHESVVLHTPSNPTELTREDILQLCVKMKIKLSDEEMLNWLHK